MNLKEKLLAIYTQSLTNNSFLPSSIDKELKVVCNHIESQKAVYTVLITLAIYKSIHPQQDIRNHQDNMIGGFSGRSNDTKYITPTLKALKLTSMGESGWLTRSLEQPYPYDFNYKGRVGSKDVKQSFLKIVDYIQNNPTKCEDVVRYLLVESIKIRAKNQVSISPIQDPDKISIEKIINSLESFFNQNYDISGGSKLPVLSFYAVYSILTKELKRYDGCTLCTLGSHTSSDRTAKTSGDIEVTIGDDLLESLEIKFNHIVDSHMINRAIEKIHKFNPKRYYVLSTYDIKSEDINEISKKIEGLKKNHGCQLIINGLIPTLKYYLRLINDIEEFINVFTNLVLNDSELKIVHKNKWKEIYENNFK